VFCCVIYFRYLFRLGEVLTSPYESTGHWQVNDYKGFSPNVDWDNVDFNSAPAIQELPVTSAICEPTAGTHVDLKSTPSIPVRGYAWSGGGRGIVRVDVSADNGQTWHTANLIKPTGNGIEQQPLNRAWAWTPWNIDLPLSFIGTEKKSNEITLVCKAIDSSYNSQPETWAPIWNLRGCLSNAWHRVPLNIQTDKPKQLTTAP
jgi:sulfite oxidase